MVWAARYLKMNGRRRLIGSFNHGTMACALPHAIGAQTAFRNRQVVALAGDGGLTMLFGELITLIQNRLPVKVIVFNNSSLNFVELEMKAAGIVNFGTELVNPDFAAVANAMGIFGRRVEQPADLQQALVDAFAHCRELGAAIVGATPLPPEGPLVMPGKYEVRLKVGEQVLRQPLEVKMDPRVAFIRNELQSSIDLQLKISAALARNFAAHQQVKDLRTHLQDLKKRPKEDPAGAAALALDAKAATLEGEPTPLLEEPVADRTNWTIARLRAEIEAREGVRISRSQLSKALRKKSSVGGGPGTR